MYVLLTTGYFDRRVVKFTRTHPELKKPLAKVLEISKPIPFSRRFDCIRLAESSKGCTP